MTEVNTEYNYDRFLEDCARALGLRKDASAYDIAAAYINKHRNIQTAMAVLFGLNYRMHRDWLVACTKYFVTAFDCSKNTATPDWLYAYQQHYINDVAAYPQ